MCVCMCVCVCCRSLYIGRVKVSRHGKVSVCRPSQSLYAWEGKLYVGKARGCEILQWSE